MGNSRWCIGCIQSVAAPSPPAVGSSPDASCRGHGCVSIVQYTHLHHHHLLLLLLIVSDMSRSVDVSRYHGGVHTHTTASAAT